LINVRSSEEFTEFSASEKTDYKGCRDSEKKSFGTGTDRSSFFNLK